jgi:hypothetical protein
MTAAPCVKALLVGETNPLSDLPEHALYPYPKGCSGERMQRLVTGLTVQGYLRTFDRVDLCVGRWSIVAARRRSQELLETPRPCVVLLGAKVCHAFGVEFEPFTRPELRAGSRTQAAVVLPHPSGLNRLWQEAGAYDRAQRLLADAGLIHLEGTY